MRAAGGTADIETGEIVIIKRCLSPIAFCNYKCINTGFLHNTAVFVHSFVIKRNESLHANGGLILHLLHKFVSLFVA